jgi:hypothetical protein
MEQRNKRATVETAFGEKLDTPLTFTYTYTELSSYDEIPSDEMPTRKAILGLVNSQRNAAARSAEQSKAFEAAGIKAPTLEDPNQRRKTLIKVLLAEGLSQDDAEAFADKTLSR